MNVYLPATQIRFWKIRVIFRDFIFICVTHVDVKQTKKFVSLF